MKGGLGNGTCTDTENPVYFVITSSNVLPWTVKVTLLVFVIIVVNSCDSN